MKDPIRLVPHLEVELQFLPAEGGGRKTPALSGYRGQFWYRNQHWDAQHTYFGREQALPGETVHAYLTFLSPELHVGHVTVGMPFLVREGHQTVALGQVVRIFDLEGSAKRSEAGGGHLGWTEAAT